MGSNIGRKSRQADRWIALAGTVFAALLLAVLPEGAAHAVAVPPLPLPGPYAVECSNVAQDFSRLAPGEDAFLYWRGVARANGSLRRPADLLTNPADTPMVTVDAPNNHDLFGSFAGRSFSYVVVICHPTSAANPRPDYALPTDRRPSAHAACRRDAAVARRDDSLSGAPVLARVWGEPDRERLRPGDDRVRELRLRRGGAVSHRRHVLGSAEPRRRSSISSTS